MPSPRMGFLPLPLSTPHPPYYRLYLLKREVQSPTERRSIMDAKTILAIGLVVFIVGALVFLKIRAKRK